jgi:hypothetical protein
MYMHTNVKYYFFVSSRREKLERKVSGNSFPKVTHAELSEPAVYESPNPANGRPEFSKCLPKHEISEEDSGTIPLRRKGRPVQVRT